MSFVTQTQGINPQNTDEADVFGLAQEGGQACVQVFFFRSGQNWGTRAYFPRTDKSMEAAEILGSFVSQFYDDKPIPKLVLLSHGIEDIDLLAEALSTHAGHKVEVLVPQRGEKRALVEHAVTNAREASGRKMAESSSQARLLAGVAEAFGLAEPPKRIEIYDNSHISGSNPVGAMVVAGPEGLMKSQYRKFNIRGEDLSGGDDFGMMREMLTRRFSRLLKEEGQRVADSETTTWPDLLLIDGGQGQLSAVRGVLADLGVGDLPVVGRGQGAGPGCGPRAFLRSGKALLHAGGARSGALLYPAFAGRGASLCHWQPQGAAHQGNGGQSVGRDCGHRTFAQESLAPELWIGQSGFAGQRWRSGGGRGCE